MTNRKDDTKKPATKKTEDAELQVQELEERIAPSKVFPKGGN